jgi:uncharacterized protein (DUF2336 family)
MRRPAREIDEALKAVALARLYFDADEPTSSDLDLQLLKLLKNGSPVLRAEMAEQLAQAANGPLRTLRALACDPDPEVSGIVLRYSDVISDATLAEVARCKGDGHLKAIAGRRRLTPKVAGVLIRRGGPEVLRTLAANRTTALPNHAWHRLKSRLQQHQAAKRKAALRSARLRRNVADTTSLVSSSEPAE